MLLECAPSHRQSSAPGHRRRKSGHTLLLWSARAFGCARPRPQHSTPAGSLLPAVWAVCEGQSGLQRRLSRIRKIWRGGLAAYKRKIPAEWVRFRGDCCISVVYGPAPVCRSGRAQRHTQRSACGISKGRYCQFGCRVGAGASRKVRLSAGSSKRISRSMLFISAYRISTAPSCPNTQAHAGTSSAV